MGRRRCAASCGGLRTQMMIVESGNDYPPCRSGRVVLWHRAVGGATLAFKTWISGENNTPQYKTLSDFSSTDGDVPRSQKETRKSLIDNFLKIAKGEKQKTSLGLPECNKAFLITVYVIEPIQNRFISWVTHNNWNTDNVWFQFTSNKVVMGFSLQF